MSLGTEISRILVNQFVTLILDNEVTVGHFVISPPLPWTRVTQLKGQYQVSQGPPVLLTAEQTTEGLNFAVRAGLDAELVLEVISKGAAQSWQMENRGHTMLQGEFEFGFAVDWMRKDLGICLDEADNNGARLPVTAIVDQFYKHVQARGGKRFDTSSLMLLLARD